MQITPSQFATLPVYALSNVVKTVTAQVKQALFAGGIARSNKPEGIRNTPGIQKWEDLELIYAGQRMQDDKPMSEYHVPPVRCATSFPQHWPK